MFVAVHSIMYKLPKFVIISKSAYQNSERLPKKIIILVSILDNLYIWNYLLYSCVCFKLLTHIIACVWYLRNSGPVGYGEAEVFILIWHLSAPYNHEWCRKRPKLEELDFHSGFRNSHRDVILRGVFSSWRGKAVFFNFLHSFHLFRKHHWDI